MARTVPGDDYLTIARPIEKPGERKSRFIFRNFRCRDRRSRNGAGERRKPCPARATARTACAPQAKRGHPVAPAFEKPRTPLRRRSSHWRSRDDTHLTRHGETDLCGDQRIRRSRVYAAAQFRGPDPSSRRRCRMQQHRQRQISAMSGPARAMQDNQAHEHDAGAKTKSPAVNRGAFRNLSSCEAIVLGRPGSDLLFQALRLSTIGAEEFNGRVRDGIGFRLLAKTTRSAKDNRRMLLVSYRP